MRLAGSRLVRQGLTTQKELDRVLGSVPEVAKVAEVADFAEVAELDEINELTRIENTVVSEQLPRRF